MNDIDWSRVEILDPEKISNEHFTEENCHRLLKFFSGYLRRLSDETDKDRDAAVEKMRRLHRRITEASEKSKKLDVRELNKAIKHMETIMYLLD